MKEKFKKVNDTFNKLAEKHKEDLENAMIKPIHPEFPFAQNGICAFIATMGSGKTYRCLKLIAQQEVLGEQPFLKQLYFVLHLESSMRHQRLSKKE